MKEHDSNQTLLRQPYSVDSKVARIAREAIKKALNEATKHSCPNCKCFLILK